MGMRKHEEPSRILDCQEHQMDKMYRRVSKGERQIEPTLGSTREFGSLEKVLAKTVTWMASKWHQDVHLTSHSPWFFYQHEGSHMEGL